MINTLQDAEMPGPVCEVLSGGSSGQCPWKYTCPTLKARYELSGAEALSPQLLYGWYRDDAGRSLWSMQQALMVVRNPGPRTQLAVTGILPPSTHFLRNSLHIDCDGHQVGSVFNYSNKTVNFSFKKLLPSFSNDLLHIKFRITDPYCPSENEISNDRRSLGFALFHVAAKQTRTGIKSVLADKFRQLKTYLIGRMAETLSHWIEEDHSPAEKVSSDYVSSDVSGLSVVIIDLQKKGALDTCLSSLQASVAEIEEPIEIIVVSNTSPVDSFRSLPSSIARRWITMKGNGAGYQAFRRGVTSATHAWVYVVDSQLAPDDSTVRELLRWRAAHVFAVSSASGSGNNWMTVRVKHGLVKPEFHELPNKTFARGALGAKRDSSLFNRALLMKIWGKHTPYRLAVWEDLEWGIRSWKRGYETIFCPNSRLHGTVETPDQNPAYAETDALRFLLRNKFHPSTDLVSLIIKVLHSDRKILAALLNPKAIYSYRLSRSMEQMHMFDEFPLSSVPETYYVNPPQDKPSLVFVSPYALFPPSHGSAVGMNYILRALVRRFSIHVLTDESEEYTDDSFPYFSPFTTVRLLSGRHEDPAKVHNRIARIESHSRPEMKQVLRMMISMYQPSFVEVEHIELAKLIDAKIDSSQPWILNLHDVFLSEDNPGVSGEDRYELDLIDRFDSLICCSMEDASLLGKSNVTIVPNGVDAANSIYQPSPAISRIIFIGPWRSPQNIPGILDFLDRVYPLLLPSFEDLELWILGGKGVLDLAARYPAFNQRGVQLIEYVNDVRELLKCCALTINPISGNRGSCRKVVESLAAGRICISTREGARGYLELNIPSLFVYERTQEFTAPIRKLLEDTDYRRSLERLNDDHQYKLSWEYSQHKLLELYDSLEGIPKNIGVEE